MMKSQVALLMASDPDLPVMYKKKFAAEVSRKARQLSKNAHSTGWNQRCPAQ